MDFVDEDDESDCSCCDNCGYIGEDCNEQEEFVDITGEHNKGNIPSYIKRVPMQPV